VISCDEAVRRLWEHLELPPTAQEQALLDAHLALCRRCCGEAGFADELRRVLRRPASEDVPPDAARRLEALIAGLEEQA
jgi:predicted anti-sigma-YlaC factor YlaD